MECMRKRHLDRSKQIHSSISLQNRQSPAIHPLQGEICLAKCPTAIILASVAGVTIYIIVRPCGMVLGQQTPHDLTRFCDECCAIGYVVLLFLVQRHALVLVQVWRKTRVVNASFCAREISRFRRKKSCVLLLQENTDEQRSHSALVDDRTF